MARKNLPKQPHRLTCLIERENGEYVSLCPELDIASQGKTVERARDNLIEAVELFFETASPSEVSRRLRSEVYITPIEVRVAQAARPVGQGRVAILPAHGFSKVRQRGSHAVMPRRDGRTTITVPVPMHRELRTGTLQSIIGQSGLARSVFETP